MKPSFFSPIFFAVLVALGSTGCATRDAAAEAEVQSRIDSTVNARVSRLQNDLQHQNDSLIDAAARRRADSVLAAPRP